MFFYGDGINKNAIYAVLIILAFYSLMSMGLDEWIGILLTLPAVIVAITFHEFAHAWTADKFGDTTPRAQGRLNLNPLSHLDLFGFVLMMFTHIGWGKPVQINPNNFNSNKSKGYCETMVSLAGPLSNYILAIISIVAYLSICQFSGNFYYTNAGEILLDFLSISITVNIGLGTFNLIPLPPLDGEKIFRHFLPYRAQDWLTRNYATLYYIFMLLWFFGLLEILVAPVIGAISKIMIKGVTFIFSLFV